MTYRIVKGADGRKYITHEPEPKQNDKDAEIERLRKALYYEENRFQRIGTHASDCWKWGPQHYECARREIESIKLALMEADSIMGHDDAETEWRDKWASLWAGKAVTP